MERFLCLNSQSIMEAQAHDPPAVSDPSVKLEHAPSASKILQPLVDNDRSDVKLPDDLILDLIWQVVNTTFSHYPKISESIASQQEYNSNVQRYGEETFLELARDSVRRNSWRDFLHNDVFVKAKPSVSRRTPVYEPCENGAHKLESTRLDFGHVLL
ncbi:hypothetical protein BGW80DRAFT_1334119 [Lactifluus volemus]|nr:hypothetical protein BGW80DRAFT_1334119 [Lactifluus volemus]